MNKPIVASAAVAVRIWMSTEKADIGWSHGYESMNHQALTITCWLVMNHQLSFIGWYQCCFMNNVVDRVLLDIKPSIDYSKQCLIIIKKNGVDLKTNINTRGYPSFGLLAVPKRRLTSSTGTPLIPWYLCAHATVHTPVEVAGRMELGWIWWWCFIWLYNKGRIENVEWWLW